MQTMREPSASLEEIMKLGPIQIYFGTQYIGDAIPRELLHGAQGR